MKKLLLFIILSAFTVNTASAAKITLNSGIFFNGEVLDVRQNELDFKTSFGKTITYTFEEIDNIDGRIITDFKSVFNTSQPPFEQVIQPVEAVKTDPVAPEEGLKILTLKKQDFSQPLNEAWDNWRVNIRDYHMNIERIVQGVNQEFESLRRKSMVATNERQVLFYIQNFRDLAISNISVLEQLNPPSDLLNYHDKIIRHLQLLNESQAFLQKMKFKEANELLSQSRKTYYEAMVELRDKFIVHGAPAEIITGMNNVLLEYDDTLN